MDDPERTAATSRFQAGECASGQRHPGRPRYGRVSRDVFAYFDTRLSNTMLASQRDVAAKAARLASGAPLRSAFSGRLERLKGADHLFPIAERLMARGINFRFDIFGAGSLPKAMRGAAAQAGLTQRFCVHGPLYFDTELVPWMRTEADLFICCHRQSDPSCTYLEMLGCGVPIVGYRNRAIEGIMGMADVAWLVRMNDLDALADRIATLDSHRDAMKQREGKQCNRSCSRAQL